VGGRKYSFAATTRVYRVPVTAMDKTSGVQRIQITHRKSRPGDWLRYKKTRSYASDRTQDLRARIQSPGR
jgi:hypothetical protein